MRAGSIHGRCLVLRNSGGDQVTDLLSSHAITLMCWIAVHHNDRSMSLCLTKLVVDWTEPISPCFSIALSALDCLHYFAVPIWAFRAAATLTARSVQLVRPRRGRGAERAAEGSLVAIGSYTLLTSFCAGPCAQD